jgi:uncharacterized BrkB/YihY/UPF0761 family membrane protein
MHKTKVAVLLCFAMFVLLCFGTGVYELWTVFNNVPNDTISHVVVSWTDDYPWLNETLIGLFVLFVIFWVAVFCHWWKPQGTFWWDKPMFESEDKPENSAGTTGEGDEKI